MHYTMVEGYPMPVRLSGHAGLDLCNTWSGWGEPLPASQPEREEERAHREYLYDFDRLAVWTQHAELISPDRVAMLRARARTEPQAAATVLSAVQRFRDASYAVLTGTYQTHVLPEPQDLVRSTTDSAAAASRLVREPNGDFVREQPANQLVSCLFAAAAAVEQVLLDPALRLSVHHCPGPHCGWLFLDPRHRRRWCSMSSCGNRAKARAHAERQRQTSAAS